MYTHRTNSNVSRMFNQRLRIIFICFVWFFFLEDFLLPREEARRLFRAYNHVWDLKIDENRVDKVFDACARNGRVVINDALKQLAN